MGKFWRIKIFRIQKEYQIGRKIIVQKDAIRCGNGYEEKQKKKQL